MAIFECSLTLNSTDIIQDLGPQSISGVENDFIEYED
jgi:hypothetical protein